MERLEWQHVKLGKEKITILKQNAALIMQIQLCSMFWKTMRVSILTQHLEHFAKCTR